MKSVKVQNSKNLSKTFQFNPQWTSPFQHFFNFLGYFTINIAFKVICNTFITRTRDIIFLSLILRHWMVTNFLEYGIQIDQSLTYNVIFKFRVMIQH